MFIEKLELIDFRGFDRLEVTFDDKLNVFIGANGAGKTSILDACSLILNHYIGKLKLGSSSNHSIEQWFEPNDVNFNSKNSKIAITFKIKDKSLIYEINKNIFETGFSFQGDDFDAYVSSFIKEATDKTSFPILIYFNSSKDFSVPTDLKDEQIKKYNKHLPQLDAYIEACNKKTYSFKEFSLWWRIEEDKENEKRLRTDPKFRSKELNIVRNAQKKFLQILKGEQYDSLFISRSNPDESQNFQISKEGDLFLKKEDKYIKVSQLSEGEKLVILLVSDIARRLVVANPNLENILQDGNGIVLIDEVDQHLHPSWQRNIVPALQKTFPALQFILTTHSPQVLSLIKDENISLIDQFKIYGVPDTYGRDSNEILELVYEVPDSPFKGEITEIYRLLSFKQMEEAKKKRDVLADKIGTDYNEVQRIDQFLETVK
ncbi:MAG TPA: AAA family ATPase [Saprospiraceae bacterium]|nr:AAA family ATPase [Saprospiraceae bacterium]HMU02439.1 AAA family ATPase [Saprospiraceae bacterium]